jgi:hypothetical protein
MDISTFKLGEGPSEEDVEVEEVETEEAPSTEVPEDQAETGIFGCIRKKAKLTCPDPDIQFYFYAR